MVALPLAKFSWSGAASEDVPLRALCLRVLGCLVKRDGLTSVCKATAVGDWQQLLDKSVRHEEAAVRCAAFSALLSIVVHLGHDERMSILTGGSCLC